MGVRLVGNRQALVELFLIWSFRKVPYFVANKGFKVHLKRSSNDELKNQSSTELEKSSQDMAK